MAPLLMCRLVLPWMRAQHCGVIINIASDAARVATPGEAVIATAMAGLVIFSRTLAMEAKRDGVRVNVLTPSPISGTQAARRHLQGGFSAKIFDKVASRAHLGLAQPEDIARPGGVSVQPAGGAHHRPDHQRERRHLGRMNRRARSSLCGQGGA